jgi:hypothetical protein
MRIQKYWLRPLVAFGVVLASLMYGAPAAAVNPPSAPPSSSGTYTVTHAACSCMSDWLEERVEGGAWSYVGTRSVTFTNKAPGNYYYRVGNWILDPYSSYFYGWTEYSVEVRVTVGSGSIVIAPLQTQLTFRYEARYGDGNGDGRTDILVNRTGGGMSGDGTIETVLLLQGAGAQFTSSVPSSSLASVAKTWPAAPVQVVLQDFNVDGFADVLLKGVANVVGGAANQIVYAPARTYAYQPRGVRAVDAGLKKFTANALDYFADSSYFANNAPTVVYYYEFAYQYCIPDYSYEWYGSMSCYWIVTYYPYAVQDYSVFDSRAVGTWTTESAIQNGSVARAQGVSTIKQSYEGVLGVSIGGRDFSGMIGEQGSFDDPTYRWGLEAFLAVLGIATANADELEPKRNLARRPDTVYITGRRVLGFLPIHTALEYAGSTLSAFDSDASTFGNGVLVSRPNAPADHPSMMMTLGTVSSTLGAPVYWTRLVTADASYDDNLPYSPVPSAASSAYNSNGFTHGLVRATAGSPSINLNSYVGGEKPVPGSAFF